MLGSPSDRKMKNRKGNVELPPLAVIGDEIGKARKVRRMSTLEISRITRIPERYVRCIEAGDFASLPGKPFVFGFTRSICVLLALDADAYVPVIRSELYGSCSDEPSILPPSGKAGSMLRRLGIGLRQS